jgi:phosphate-selective porin OprO and OprP
MSTRRTLGLLLGVVLPAVGGCVAVAPVPWEPVNPWPTGPNASAAPNAVPATTAASPAGGFASEAVATTGPALPAASLLAPTATAAAPTLPPPEPALAVPADSPVPAAAPAAKGPDFKLRGRVEADAIAVNQSEKNKLLYGNFQNAVGFRRARIGVEGTVGPQTRWVAEWDFAGGDVSFKDLFIAVNHLPVVREVRVGHLAEPFSLEGQTRSVWFPFVERSPQFALDPARNWGVGVYSHTDDQRLVVQGGVFRSGTDNTGTDIGDGNDLAVTARVTGLPWYEGEGNSFRLLHVGGAVSQRYAKNDTVTFNQGPQSSLLQSGTDNGRVPFLPTIVIPATQNQLFNLQAALVLGPLSFQAEWTGTRVDQIGGGPVVFQGAYLLASYFLTGEHRDYNREFGTFWEPTVRCPFICTDGPGGIGRGPGAWELTARLAYVDFDSSKLQPGPDGLPVGNRLTTVTLGVNWYLYDNARIMFDYVHAVPVDPTFGSSTADTITVRSALFW